MWYTEIAFFSTDKHQVKQLRVTHKTPGRKHKSINQSQIFHNFDAVNTLKVQEMGANYAASKPSRDTWMEGSVILISFRCTDTEFQDELKLE